MFLKVGFVLKRSRWGILPVLLVSAFMLSACREVEVPVTGDPGTVTLPDILSSEIPENKEYRQLFEQYRQKNEEYFSKTEAATKTLIGQKYAYAVTAYDHSETLSEIAEMFFDISSENTLNIYFALRGYEEKSYSYDGSSAEYVCRKKDDRYRYTVSYDTEKSSIDITLYVNDELRDRLYIEMTDDTLSKLCYSGTLQRTFVSRVNNDGTSRVDWYDELIQTLPEEQNDEGHGYVIYDGVALSGVIK